jgi:hypothetical protein
VDKGPRRIIVTLTQTLPARTARARSHYLGELIDVLRSSQPEAGQANPGALRRLAEEAAQIACRLAWDARVLWNAAQEQMYATGKDDLPLREYARSMLADARALAEDTLKTAPEMTGAFVDLQKEADRLRQELAATELAWDASAGLRLDPKVLEQAHEETARGDFIDLEEWLRELQGSGG